jgi:predicted membrane-bound spermidine synthase
VSTFGGIITTFFVGFYSLPQFGLSITLFFYGALVIATALLLFIYSKKLNASALIIIFFSISAYAFNQQIDTEQYLYKSEGILGEVKVIDEILYSPEERQNKAYRKLMVNNISQTIMDIQNPHLSYWAYVKMIVYNLNSYAKNKDALLLGMGGGTILKQLKKDGFSVDVVEIDARMETVAHQFFGVSNNNNIIIDDARHYIRTSPRKYDAIIYDLYNSETPPIHLMTKEAFSEINGLLNKDGILAINFYGFTEGSRGKAARSIYKTLQSEGFSIQLLATEGQEQYRNLLFLCSPGTLSPSLKEKDIKITANNLDLDDAVILTDEKPELEHLYLEAAINWRTNYNKANFRKIIQSN